MWRMVFWMDSNVRTPSQLQGRTLDALDGPNVHSLGNCGTVGMSYLEHSLKAYDYTKTVQSLRMLGWKNQSWRTRNQ